ncbi:MAG: alpha/beta hydrolase [Clostridia bacterium]|nr:alpha/beta hydrolase [Clostridia bacterium]
MGFIVKKYVESFMVRYDSDEGIPFPGYADFPGLVCEPASFRNSDGVEIKYCAYYYDGHRNDKLILFLHGLGPGHTPYTVDIEQYCRAGYKVLAPDYTGCGASGGEALPSVNAPARDAVELIELLDPKEEVVPVGHSLGGYTALTVANCLPRVKRAVIISGFVSVADEMIGAVKLRLLTGGVTRYEKKRIPRFRKLDNRAYLASTEDKILWIHSKDDPVVNFKYNAGQAIKLGNPNVRVIAVENKQHMPQYTRESLGRMNEWLGEYNREVNEKKLVTPEEKKAFFLDKPVIRMMEPDPAVFGEILDFIK